MATIFLPSYETTPFEVIDAWRRLFCNLGLDWYVTLNLNRGEMTQEGARKRFKNWLARIDHEHLGSDWYKRGNDRTFAVAVTEHPYTNLHFHVLLKMAKPAQQLRRPDQSESLIRHWTHIAPGGQCCPIPIKTVEGIASYMSKEFYSWDRVERIILSTEFHTYRKK
jgi:hypothetical protein